MNWEQYKSLKEGFDDDDAPAAPASPANPGAWSGGRFANVQLGRSADDIVRRFKANLLRNLTEMIEEGQIQPQMTVEQLMQYLRS